MLFRDLPRDEAPGSRPTDPYTRFDLAGAPYQPDLSELIGILDTLAQTLTELTPVVLGPIVHRGWRERLRERFGRQLPLVGPNFHVRSRPRYLRESLRLPDFPRFSDGNEEAELMVQTPPMISAYDRDGRVAMIRREIRQLLRTLQYRDFESYVDALEPNPPERQVEVAERSLAVPADH